MQTGGCQSRCQHLATFFYTPGHEGLKLCWARRHLRRRHLSDRRRTGTQIGDWMAKYYSLWIEPTGSLDDWLQERMKQLFPIYESPVFRPHITLLGDIHGPEDHVIAVADSLLSGLQPFDVKFDKVAAGQKYYQNVYILCTKTPALMAAGSNAREAFNMDSTAEYMPHLSLIYGTLPQSDRCYVSPTFFCPALSDQQRID
eukprot:jgi/Botrbrau1/253/Bobra.0022s0226.2